MVGPLLKYTYVWLLSAPVYEVCNSSTCHYVNKMFLVPLQLRAEVENRSQDLQDALCLLPNQSFNDRCQEVVTKCI